MAIENITGSVPDVTGMVLGLADALSAKEGFSYNLCIFKLPLGDEAGVQQTQKQSATLPSQQTSASSAATAVVPSLIKTPTAIANKPTILEARGTFGYPGEGKVMTRALITVNGTKSSEAVICVVALESLKGFNTKLGSQMSIEVGWEACPGGAILVIKGFLDPAGSGYAHFLGQVFIRIDTSRNSIVTSPIGELQLVQAKPGVIDQIFSPAGGTIWGRRTNTGFIIEFTA